MRVLVTGAYGFIGAHITAALIGAGHDVVCAVREARIDTRFPGVKTVACDMATDTSVSDWLPRLAGVDAVVNCAGILRETSKQTFLAVHELAPHALFQACAQLGVRRVVQISALGNADDGLFVASKHRGDNMLASLNLDWVIVRPSLVYSAHGSYGGSSLLRGLAALPCIMPVPGQGNQHLQPISAEDLGTAVAAALTSSHAVRQVVELVGPDVLSLQDYLLCWRRWLGFAPPHVMAVPLALVKATAFLGDNFGRGPLGMTMARMLERGNVGAADALGNLRDRLGCAPRSLQRVLQESPSHVQDRWHARLYFLLPTLRIAIALLWVLSGITGWLISADDILAATPGSAWSLAQRVLLERSTASADLLLGVLCLIRWRSRLVLSLMLAMLCGYMLGIGVLWPAHWLDPFGGLLKNLPLLVALLVLLATDERR